MGKLTKDWLSCASVNQPEGTIFWEEWYCHDLKNSMENEPGFTLSPARIPYGTSMGVISLTKHPVIFSTNNVNSAISYYDEINDVIIPILDDASMSFC